VTKPGLGYLFRAQVERGASQSGSLIYACLASLKCSVGILADAQRASGLPLAVAHHAAPGFEFSTLHAQPPSKFAVDAGFGYNLAKKLREWGLGMINLTADWRKSHRHRYEYMPTDGDFMWEPKPPAMPRTFPEDKHRIGSVYAIICKPTAQAYIGQSKSVKTRLIQHKSNLRAGKHHSPKLQQAWDKHGEQAFLFVVVERRIDLIFLHAREQFWMWRFGDRLLNKSESAHPDRSNGVRMQALKSYADEELITELKRRNIAVMVVP